MRVGELSEIPYKGVEQKRGEGKQRFQKGGGRGQAGSKCGCLKKKQGAGTPLRTMFLYRVFRRFDKDLCNFFCEMCKVSIFRDLFSFAFMWIPIRPLWICLSVPYH